MGRESVSMNLATTAWASSFKAHRSLRSAATIAAIVLMHASLVYALQNRASLMPHTQIVSTEVVAAFIAPSEAIDIAVPRPLVPKIVAIVKKVPTQVKAAVVAEAALTQLPVISNSPQPSSLAAPMDRSADAPEQDSTAPPTITPSAPAKSASPKIHASGIEYLQMPQPAYPAAAKRMGEEGKVILRVLVDEKGRPEQIMIQQSSGSPRLDDAAKQAVRRALFKPFIDNGKAVSAFAIVPITFELDS